MNTIKIYDYRTSGIEENELQPFDTTLISKLLVKYGLVQKECGLCSPPWNKFFSFGYQDPKGVTHSRVEPRNACYIRVNEATSTYSKRRYFYSMKIVKDKESYYVTALTQSSRYTNPVGAEHSVYKCLENELDDVMRILFQDVK